MADPKADPLWLTLASVAEEQLGRGELGTELLRQRLEQYKSSRLAVPAGRYASA